MQVEDIPMEGTEGFLLVYSTCQIHTGGDMQYRFQSKFMGYDALLYIRDAA